MRNLLYIMFLLVLGILLNACKMHYTTSQDDPYRIFTKGKRSGLINTETKEIIIPAKYTYIEQYIGATQKQENYFTYKHEDRFFVTYDYRKEQELQFLYDINGTVLYRFQQDEFPEMIFVHNQKIYLITKSSEFKFEDEYGFADERVNRKLIRINENHAKELLSSLMIHQLGSKNMISFSDIETVGFYDLNTDKKVAFKYYDDYYHSFYVIRKNEIWLKTYNPEKRMSNPYYDTVIDSTLTIQPNPVKNALMPYENYYFSETEKGIQVTDYEGNSSPFAYPYLQTVKNGMSSGRFSTEVMEQFDQLFLFSSQKDGAIKGIINKDGKIILPDTYQNIFFRKIYNAHNDEFKAYIKENKLNKYYFTTIRNEEHESEYTVFNEHGMEIISFRYKKHKNCSHNFDIMENNRLQIQFDCADSLKIYDLKTKELMHSESKKRN